MDGVGGRLYSWIVNRLFSKNSEIFFFFFFNPEAPGGGKEPWPSLRMLDAGLRVVRVSEGRRDLRVPSTVETRQGPGNKGAGNLSDL